MNLNTSMKKSKYSDRRGFLKSTAAWAAGCVAAPLMFTGCGKSDNIQPSVGTTASLPEPDEDGFISLFDGNTLAGWHTNPDPIGHGTGGRWIVDGGAITGEQDPPGSGNGGVLLTDLTFGDFELLIDLKPDWGIDSGLFLRANDEGQCFQMMVDYLNDGNVGHVYGEGIGGFSNRTIRISGTVDDAGDLIGLSAEPADTNSDTTDDLTASSEDWAGAWKIGAWNTVRVRCEGAYPKITTWINDEEICVFDGATFEHPNYNREEIADMLGSHGSIGVQVHGGDRWTAGAKCRWKNIRVKPL